MSKPVIRVYLVQTRSFRRRKRNIKTPHTGEVLLPLHIRSIHVTCLLSALLIIFFPLIFPPSSGFAYADTTNPITYSGKALSVPGNYATIQEAVNAADSGDTIYVEAGTYRENILITKNGIKLSGHGNSDTIIAGNATGDGLKVQANNVTVSGFTLRNFAIGIHLYKVSSGSVLDNYVTGNKFGIWLNYASNSLLVRNRATDNEHNIRLSFSTNNTLSENTMQGQFSYNFGLFGSSPQHYFQTIDTSNTVNGEPIQYITNAENLIIDPQTYPNIGALLVVNSSGITVRDLTLSKNLDGVLFAYVSTSTIQNIMATDNKIGIELFRSQNIAVLNNSIRNNMYHGILLSGSSQIEVEGNNLVSNSEAFYIMNSNSSVIQRNTVYDNGIGLKLYESDGNVVFHNNFLGNQKQTDIYNSQNNRFDNGVEGNYWSNYTGEDANNDAIGDNKLPHEQLDRYPLMGRYQQFNITKEGDFYSVELISKITMDAPYLNPSKGTLGFRAFTNETVTVSRLIIPRILVSNASIVTVNNSKPIFQNEKSNETHTILYLVFPPGNSQIEIGATAAASVLAAEAGPNQKVTPYALVRFDGSGSNSSLGIENYEWAFGDGTSGSGAFATHTYSKPGIYIVTLTVKDAAGNTVSDSLTITVEESPENKVAALPTWFLALTVFIDVIAVTSIVRILVMRIKRKKK